MAERISKLYSSFKLRRNLAANSRFVPLGAAHYSYGSVYTKFKELFEYMNIKVIELDRPEIYADMFNELDVPIHIMFKPFEEIRVLHFGFNIAHVAWEFDTIPRSSDWHLGDPRRGEPFADYVRMLEVPEMLWVGCEYTKDILLKNGLENVEIVPAPINTSTPVGLSGSKGLSLADVSDDGDALNLKILRLDRRMIQKEWDDIYETMLGQTVESIFNNFDCISLSVLNPGDMRKNLPAMIDGFSLACHTCPNSALIIKLVIDNRDVTLQSTLTQLIPKRYTELELRFGEIGPKNVFLLSEMLSSEMLQQLYQRAHFYLSASVAEGQNLPLLESMANRMVPVSVQHTAMRDYIRSDNAIIVSTHRIIAPEPFERAYGVRGFSLNYCNADDIASAVIEASLLDKTEYEILSSSAWDTVDKQFSFEVLSKRVGDLLTRIRGDHK